MSRLPPLAPGDVFGRLTLIERLVKPRPGTNKHRPHWRCTCTCGNTPEPCEYALRRGDTRSCGCLHDEKAAQRMKDWADEYRPQSFDGFINSVLAMYQERATRRRLSWELSRDKFVAMVQMVCHYCGTAPAQRVGKYRFVYNGIDRQNNALGYREDNCVPCCGRCNVAKSDSSYEDFMKWRANLVAFALKQRDN